MLVLFERFFDYPRWMRRRVWKVWHAILVRLTPAQRVRFMNYGYADDASRDIKLEADDEQDRYFIQLYHHVGTGAGDLTGKDVLEVGSGRGGGAYYVSRYLKPRTYTGVDQSLKGVQYCTGNYTVDGLSFVRGDGQALPFPDASFDVVMNVEASGCYDSMEAFLAGVKRVLRPGGYFTIADMRKQEEMPGFTQALKNSGLEMEKELNMVKNVLRAMEEDSERKIALIDEKAPKFMVKHVSDWAGTKGSRRYEAFMDGTFEYWSYVFRKEA